MSAIMVTLRTSASEVPAVIAGSVNLLKFSEALARAGIVGRYDSARGVLVIEPVPERCRACGGSGLDDDARCDFCAGAGRHREGGKLPQETAQRPGNALIGLAWYNGLTRQERREWHQRAGSAVPADTWKAFKAGGSQSC